jgi:hypothetical protein
MAGRMSLIREPGERQRLDRRRSAGEDLDDTNDDCLDELHPRESPDTSLYSSSVVLILFSCFFASDRMMMLSS